MLKKFKFIIDKCKSLYFRIITVIIIFFGAQASFNTIWDLADVLMGFMAIMNIVVILLLGKIAFKCLKDYSIQKRKKKINFHPDNLGIKNAELCKDIEKK